jgi:hypothetical protein
MEGLGHVRPTAPYPGLDAELQFNEFVSSGEPPAPLPHATLEPPGANPSPDQLTTALAKETGLGPDQGGRHPARQWHTASFEPVPRSVRDARQFVGSLLEDPALRETGELLVSELTTNALQHTAGRFEVRVQAEPHVRVEVRDGSAELPSLKDLASTDENGRGLQIVTQLATSWGTRELPDGKVVWFEL